MNPAPQVTPAPRRRRLWPWVLLGAGICLSPFLLLGVAAVSYLSLDRDVRVLREHVMDATDARWKTKVQMSVGRLTLGAVGQGLRFVDNKDMADARLALGAVKRASVGIYERTAGSSQLSPEDFFVKTDRAMQKRGWTRLVGVSEKKEAVLVYIQEDLDADEPVDLCVAVVNDREMVVVSTTVDPDAIQALVARHAGDDLKRNLRFAKLKF
jgi:hypothetical protein